VRLNKQQLLELRMNLEELTMIAENQKYESGIHDKIVFDQLRQRVQELRELLYNLGEKLTFAPTDTLKFVSRGKYVLYAVFLMRLNLLRKLSKI